MYFQKLPLAGSLNAKLKMKRIFQLAIGDQNCIIHLVIHLCQYRHHDRHHEFVVVLQQANDFLYINRNIFPRQNCIKHLTHAVIIIAAIVAVFKTNCAQGIWR